MRGLWITGDYALEENPGSPTLLYCFLAMVSSCALMSSSPWLCSILSRGLNALVPLIMHYICKTRSHNKPPFFLDNHLGYLL